MSIQQCREHTVFLAESAEHLASCLRAFAETECASVQRLADVVSALDELDQMIRAT